MVTPVGLAALAAAAASFPTGFGFGAGYGAGVRIGYDVIYPKIAPFAAKITDDILAAVDNLFGTGDTAQSSGTSGFAFAAGSKDRTQPFPPASGGGRAGRPSDLTVVSQNTEGRRAGASELQSNVSGVVATVTSPLTRTQLVHFKNYKTAVESLNRGARTGNYQGQAVRMTTLKQRSFKAIKDQNWWPQYYDWLKTF